MLDELIKDPDKIGVVVLLLFALVAFMRDWVCTSVNRDKQLTQQRTDFEARLTSCERDKNEWKDIALTSTGLAERLAEKRR